MLLLESPKFRQIVRVVAWVTVFAFTWEQVVFADGGNIFSRKYQEKRTRIQVKSEILNLQTVNRPSNDDIGNDKILGKLDETIRRANELQELINGQGGVSGDSQKILSQPQVLERMLQLLAQISFYLSSLLSLLGHITIPNTKNSNPREIIVNLIENVNLIKDSLTTIADNNNTQRLPSTVDINSLRESLSKLATDLSFLKEIIAQNQAEVKKDDTKKGTLPIIKKGQSPFLLTHPSGISIPADAGSIEGVYEPIKNGDSPKKMGQSPFLIHIQDAHANYGAQKNEARIIEHIITHYKEIASPLTPTLSPKGRGIKGEGVRNDT